MKLYNRREIFLSCFAFGMTLLGTRLFASIKDAISESDSMAMALGYKHDAKKADSAKYPQLKKPEAKTQRCNNCNFYTAAPGGWGKCQLLQSGQVNANGWCASWIKKG